MKGHGQAKILYKGGNTVKEQILKSDQMVRYVLSQRFQMVKKDIQGQIQVKKQNLQVRYLLYLVLNI